MRTLVVGIDPGVTTGIFSVPYLDGIAGIEPIAVQVHGPEGVLPVVHALIQRSLFPPLLAVEAFVIGPRSARSGTPEAGRVTRKLIGALTAVGADYDVAVISKPAGLVKPWATDHRLDAAGFLDPTKGMQHARDAARHALYVAVHQGVTRDPLSRVAAR